MNLVTNPFPSGISIQNDAVSNLPEESNVPNNDSNGQNLDEINGLIVKCLVFKEGPK